MRFHPSNSTAKPSLPCQKCGKPNSLTPYEYMEGIICEECIAEFEAQTRADFKPREKRAGNS